MLSKILNEKDGKKFASLKTAIYTELRHSNGGEKKGENTLHFMSIYDISTFNQMIKTFESHGTLGLAFGLSDSNKGFWHSKGNSYSDPDSFNSYYWRKDHRDKLIDKLKKLTDKIESTKLFEIETDKDEAFYEHSLKHLESVIEEMEKCQIKPHQFKPFDQSISYKLLTELYDELGSAIENGSIVDIEMSLESMFDREYIYYLEDQRKYWNYSKNNKKHNLLRYFGSWALADLILESGKHNIQEYKEAIDSDLKDIFKWIEENSNNNPSEFQKKLRFVDIYEHDNLDVKTFFKYTKNTYECYRSACLLQADGIWKEIKC